MLFSFAGFIVEMDARGAYIILSNSDSKNVDPEDDFFENLYADYDVHCINAKRKINRSTNHRGSQLISILPVKMSYVRAPI